MIDPLLEKYIQIIENNEKTGEVTPDGESTLEIRDKNKVWRNKQGQYHRRDGLAIIYADGSKFWFINNKLHREDGPAVLFDNGNKEWRLNDKLHRLDGPAVVNVDGYKAWYKNGVRHREDGPAIERHDGSKAWYIDGKHLSEDHFYNYVVKNAIKKKK